MLSLQSFNLGFSSLKHCLPVTHIRFWMEPLIMPTSSSIPVPTAPIAEQCSLGAADPLSAEELPAPYELFRGNFNLTEMNFPSTKRQVLVIFTLK